MSREIILDTKYVWDIEGKFYVPSYQRGYRWGEDEVIRLLDDVLTNGKNNYCLQPIVVRNNGDSYELIDGQQRLTTLYLVYFYMAKVNSFFSPPKFSLTYETRDKSEEFLKNIELDRRDENIDFWFIANAYETIENWFQEDLQSRTMHIFEYFKEDVKVIWYEIDENEDAISLFTRLNIGRIPLTSSELVKAMFLSKDNGENITREKQEEIALQWDNIEKELHNESLWYFLTNKTGVRYQTRIDLVLDLIAEKKGNPDKYYTFFALDDMRKQKSLDSLWQRIQRSFLILKDWFEDHELYHKIGYLVASDSMSLFDIFAMSQDKTKDAFRASLDDQIRKSVEIEGDYSGLSYENRQDYDKISRLLLLFNVESVRQNGAKTQWFPFEKFKISSDSNVSWSLEHIHAQQSEGLNKQELWKEWLTLHIPSIKTVCKEDNSLAEEMEKAASKEKLEGSEFKSIQDKVLKELSDKGGTDYIHSISNLALLNTADNAALNNSTFDVKRREIIKLDKVGKYIPFCTKMVFLKYYTQSADIQLHFWGQQDRVAYIDEINRVLADYLSEPIAMEKEEA